MRLALYTARVLPRPMVQRDGNETGSEKMRGIPIVVGELVDSEA